MRFLDVLFWVFDETGKQETCIILYHPVLHSWQSILYCMKFHNLALDNIDFLNF